MSPNEQKHFIPSFDAVFIDLFCAMSSLNNFLNPRALFDHVKSKEWWLRKESLALI